MGKHRKHHRGFKYLTHNGVTLSYADWARKMGVEICTITRRLRRGWSVEDTLTKPIRGWDKRPKPLYFTWIKLKKKMGMCEKWEDYHRFEKDVGQRKGEFCVLDHSKPVGPNNYKWASHKEACLTNVKARRITHDGKTHTITEWAQIKKMSRITLVKRLQEWSIHDALETPVRERRVGLP